MAKLSLAPCSLTEAGHPAAWRIGAPCSLTEMAELSITELPCCALLAGLCTTLPYPVYTPQRVDTSTWCTGLLNTFEEQRVCIKGALQPATAKMVKFIHRLRAAI